MSSRQKRRIGQRRTRGCIFLRSEEKTAFSFLLIVFIIVFIIDIRDESILCIIAFILDIWVENILCVVVFIIGIRNESILFIIGIIPSLGVIFVVVTAEDSLRHRDRNNISGLLNEGIAGSVEGAESFASPGSGFITYSFFSTASIMESIYSSRGVSTGSFLLIAFGQEVLQTTYFINVSTFPVHWKEEARRTRCCTS